MIRRKPNLSPAMNRALDEWEAARAAVSMAAERPSVDSRELAAYLAVAAAVMSATEMQLHLMLGRDAVPYAAVDDVNRLVDWLRSADFMVQDPFRFKLVCEHLDRVTDEDITQRADQTLGYLRRMARAALKDESLLEFIK